MKRLSFCLLLLLTSPAYAWAEQSQISLQLQSVLHLSDDIYEISDGTQSFTVHSARASVLPDLQNFDALSEDWNCTVENSTDGYRLIGCSHSPFIEK